MKGSGDQVRPNKLQTNRTPDKHAKAVGGVYATVGGHAPILFYGEKPACDEGSGCKDQLLLNLFDPKDSPGGDTQPLSIYLLEVWGNCVDWLTQPGPHGVPTLTAWPCPTLP